MNAPWDITVRQGRHLPHNTSVPLEHGATRLNLSELNNVQSALPGKKTSQCVCAKS